MYVSLTYIDVTRYYSFVGYPFSSLVPPMCPPVCYLKIIPYDEIPQAFLFRILILPGSNPILEAAKA